MVDYVFNNILNQQVSFVPASDTLRFIGHNAAQTLFTTAGIRLNVSVGSQRITLDATPLLASTSLGIFTPTNITFSDGSMLAIGDLSTDDTLDGGDNVIDFTSNILLTGALNLRNQVHGLGGSDSISFAGSSAAQLVFGGGGGDTIISGNGDNTLYGGLSAVDTLDGNDVFQLGSGNNIIYGNAGADTVSFVTGPLGTNLTRFYGGLGADSLTGSANGIFEVVGGPDNDTIIIENNQNANTLYGGAGNDTINLTDSAGTNLIFGGNGVADTADGGDAITLGGGNVTLYSNAGTDSVLGAVNSGRVATIYLGAANDVMTSKVATGLYQIYAGPAGDSIDLTNHTGDATIYGGSGEVDSTDTGDTIIGSSSGNNLIFGNGGADAITVRPGAGQTGLVYGGAGNDTITATVSSQTASYELYGNSGNDTFALDFTASGATIHIQDYIAGQDVLEITLSGGGSAADLTVTREATQTLLLHSTTQNIVLTGYTGNFNSRGVSFDDDSVLITNYDQNAATLTGTDKDDQLIAGSRGDTIVAGGGDDLIIGGIGNDQITIATNNFSQGDIIRGGAGRDILLLTTPSIAITDNLFQQKTSIELLRLDSGDFSVNSITIGTNGIAAGIEQIDATRSTKATLDLVSATRGLSVQTGTGTDSVAGSNHADTITLGAGADTVNGGRGADTITGGDGADLYEYFDRTSVGPDTIMDFNFATADTQADLLEFGSLSENFNLGNRDTIVDGAIVDTVRAAGAIGTELIIVRNVGISAADISNHLDIINGNVAAGSGVLNIFYSSSAGQVTLYYDSNGSTAGGHTHLISFANLTTIGALNNVDFNDFIFS